jgi:hypothetical protein
MQTRLQPADAIVLAVICCFAAGLFAVWAAHDFTWSSRKRKAEAPVHQPRKAPAHKPRVAVRPPRPADRRPSPHLTLFAARGAAWVSVRAGSITGRTLYEGLLSPRQRLTLPGKRFVVRVQGGSNLDAMLGKHRVNLGPHELRDMLITTSGIRVLATRPVHILQK